ncbi:MAG: sugar phosphate isomerase/epimerase [Clostridiales bacterium]|nr:sugar phosphate isomerase/epimerase [Clostridiales bacterium]
MILPGVSSYSFQRLIDNGEYDQIKLIGLAKSMGFAGIEFADLFPHNNESKKDYAMRLRDESERLDMPILNYAVGADFLNCEDFEKQLQELYEQVNIAKILGTIRIRHDVSYGFKFNKDKFIGFDEALPTLVKGCKAVTEYGKSKGISTMVENHGIFCQSSDRILKLISAVADDNFGTLTDIGNFMCVDEDPETAVSKTAPFARYVHVKDFHFKKTLSPEESPNGYFKTYGGHFLRGAVLGEGVVPVKNCLSILKNNGYSGYVSIEFEGVEDNIPAVRKCLGNLEKILNNI